MVGLINGAINLHRSDSQVAAAFGLSRQVIVNHRRTLHPGVNKEEATRGTPHIPVGEVFIPADGTPREKLQAVIDKLESQGRGGTLRVDVARELRIAYSDLDKMSGGLPPAIVRPQDVQGLPALLAAMQVALEPFPEARLALVKVLEESDL
ncbi:MAG TPA: hypothetical protein VNF73_07310 [Candidatus Saccharimonadales bacterium]|nr:hypothetical protein [Candidatus Saccharimonadales bacterium]